MFVGNKRTSLFCQRINDEEKSFYYFDHLWLNLNVIFDFFLIGLLFELFI